MATPLLTTKLYIPPARPDPSTELRTRLVSRPRLIERLNMGLHRKLTLVSAPAGFGKTTLLSEWASQRVGESASGRPVAWVSLDKGDNDPTRFWTYFIAALQTVESHVGEGVLSALQSSQPPSMEALLTTVINDIAAATQEGDHEGRPYILVFDDYHLITAQPIHDGLVFLLDHLPPQMHLIITTRADPPLSLARLRGRGQLIELRAVDLRFTFDEAAAFLNDLMGLGLSAEDIAALDARTEGWIAGLQMAALSMRGRKDVSEFIRAFSGSHRFVLDYLVEEVLDQQSPAIQEFLLKTCILERMTSSLCDAITDREDSQAILAQLEQANLFLVPLDDERRWYRYHHLFADLLRQRLQREWRDLVPELHRRASEWYEQNELISKAVSHALASGDYGRGADLIEQMAWPMLMRGEMTTLFGWLDALPDELVGSRPRLGVSRAWALAFTGQVDDVEACLSDVDVQHVQGEVIAVRAYIAGLRLDVSCAIELAHQALEHLPEEDLFLRGFLVLNLGVAYWRSGDLVATGRALTEAIMLSRAADQKYLTLRAMVTLGHVQKMQGLLRQTVETHRQALELADEPGSRPVPFAGIAYLGIAESLYEWNDLDGAMRYAMEGIKLRELGGFVAYLLLGHAILARVYQVRGGVDSALEVIQKAERLAQRHDDARLAAVVGDMWARLWVAQGNLATASRWAREHRLGPVDELNSAREVEQLAVVRVLIASASVRGSTRGGEIGEALELLARLLEAAEAAERMGSVIKILPLQALAFQAQGDLNQALSALERALSLAEPEGYVRTFVDEGEPMARLLRQALSQGIAPNYVARLLAAFGQEVELASSAMESMVEPLSERELEVLRLVVAGLSNPEIAQELVIAVSTVKSHINHIYGKLGVKSRTQAVARARELGLL